MTKRYDLSLNIASSTEPVTLIHLIVTNKTMDTLQALIRLAMADMEKVEPLPVKKRRRGHTPKRIDPPIEIMTEDRMDIYVNPESLK